MSKILSDKLKIIYEQYFDDFSELNKQKIVKIFDRAKQKAALKKLNIKNLDKRRELSKKPKIPKQEAAFISLNEKVRIKNEQLFLDLTTYIDDDSRARGKLSQFICTLEANNKLFLEQANYWYNSRLLYTVMGGFATNFIIFYLTAFFTGLKVDIAPKIQEHLSFVAPLASIIVGGAVLWFVALTTQRSGKLKQLVSQTESFIVVAKGVLEQENK